MILRKHDTFRNKLQCGGWQAHAVTTSRSQVGKRLILNKATQVGCRAWRGGGNIKNLKADRT